MPDWETYQAAYAKASIQLQEYLVSNELVSLATNLCQKHGLASEIQHILVTLLSDRILSLVSSSVLVEKLNELDVPDTAIIEITRTIDALITQFNSDDASKLTAADSATIASQVHQAEAGLEAIPSVRTMQSTPAETVYTSTQAAILHEGTTPDSPTATNTGPRWDSAQ